MPDALLSLALLMALVLSASLHGLAASGHFPREHRSPALASGIGRLILVGSIAWSAVCLVTGIASAARLLPWYALVIGGGLSILSAPLILQRFPERFVDSRHALIAFALGTAVPAAVLLWIAIAGAVRQ